MVIDHLFGVVHAAVTNLYSVAIEDFAKVVILGKCLCTKARNL